MHLVESIEMAFPPFGMPATSVQPLIYNVRRVHMTPPAVTIRRKRQSFRASCIIGIALGLVISIFWFIAAASAPDFNVDNEAFITDYPVGEE